MGRAIHRLLQARTDREEVGEERFGELYQLDADDAGRLAFLAAHLRLPVPAGALAEVPLGYWPDGSARRVEGGAGSYRDDGQILSGTVDAMWAEPGGIQVINGSAVVVDYTSTLWIVDWKTGAEEHVPPIDRNWQLRGAAVLAARWTGARRVIPAICYVNAAECAEAVREGRAYEGRWEVGAPLDAAALDEIEREMRAVLARARGDRDANQVESVGDRAGHRGVGTEQGGDAEVRAGGSDLGDRHVQNGGDRGHDQQRGALILGPHCDHCPARGACPALAREAVTLLGALKDLTEEEAGWLEDLIDRVRDKAKRNPASQTGAVLALTPSRAAHLAGIIPALRRILDAAEVAVRAHVEATGAPLVLSDGREYGPALEEVRSYRTRPAYEALAAVVGDAAADEAFETNGTALRAALAGQPRGAWGRLKEDLEARGAVVVGVRGVWRKKWPAKPVEGGDDGAGQSRGGVDDSDRGGDRGRDPRDPRARQEPGAVHDAGASGREAAAREGEGDRGAVVLGGDARDGAPPTPTGGARAPCSLCGVPVAVTTKGLARKHQAPGAATYCAGSGKPPAKPAEQLSL